VCGSSVKLLYPPNLSGLTPARFALTLDDSANGTQSHVVKLSKNLFSDAKGQATSGSNREGESTEAKRRGGAAVVVMKAL
jgi:hypothetical protein